MTRAGALTLLAKLKDKAGTAAAVKGRAASLLQLLHQASSSPSPARQGNTSSTAATSLTSAHSSASPSPTLAAVGLSPTTAAAPVGSAPASSSGLAAGSAQQSVGRTTKLCWSCGVTGVPLKKCSVCAVAAYCGAGCQKVDWKAHKGQCQGLKAGAGGSLSSAAGEK